MSEEDVTKSEVKFVTAMSSPQFVRTHRAAVHQPAYPAMAHVEAGSGPDRDGELASVQPPPPKYSAANKARQVQRARALPIGPHVDRDPMFPNLVEWLVGRKGEEGVDDLIADVAHRLPHATVLRRLVLHNTPALTELNVYTLAYRGFAAAFTLTHLTVTHCKLTSDCVVPLCDWLTADVKAQSLHHLDLSHNALDSAACGLVEAMLLAHRGVRTLSLRGNALSEEDHSSALIHLLATAHCVDHLDAGFTGVQDSGVVKLCTVLASNDCRLRTLNLDGADVTQRVALLLLGKVRENNYLQGLSARYVASCCGKQYAATMSVAFAMNVAAEEEGLPRALKVR
jgi:hypothetical protein